MADVTQQKRQREEETNIREDFDDPKRQKTTPQDHILSILEEDEDELNQDLSDIFTTLQQELSCVSSTTNFDDHDPLPYAAIDAELDHQQSTGSSATPDCSPSSKEDEDGDVYNNVMRHLLEASDDELGLPNRVDGGDDEINGGDLPFPLSNGLWEFEDETANYYAMLQSELFM